MTTHQPLRRSRAFTLVELLVVIGIIALLISILLPTLGKAREASKRAVCLANLRTIGQAYQLYANDYKDQIPLGCRSNQMQRAYEIWDGNIGTTGQWMTFGLLYQNGKIKDGRYFYCPSDNTDANQYDTPSNPFKPGVPGATNVTRTGYLARSVDLKDRGIFWKTSATAASVPNPVVDQNNKDWLPFPKLGAFKQAALVADVFSSPQRVNARHKNGINVLYADGHAKWVGRDVIAKDLDQTTYTGSTPGLPDNFVGANSTTTGPNGGVNRIWKILDRQ